MNSYFPFAGSEETWLHDIVMDPYNNQITAKLSFPANLSAFQGHFPGYPILPGVFLISAVRLLADKIMVCNFLPFYYENIKFKQVVVPEQRIDLIIKVKNNNGKYCLSFKCFSTAGLVANGSIHCTIKE